MTRGKNINRICAVIAICTVLITVLFMNGKALGLQGAKTDARYVSRLFDTSSVHRIDIVMDDWDSFLETCENEEYTACSVLIDGEKFKNVGIRAKGNTSLSNVRQLGSQRYSFKIEFDHFETGKTYYGLDKLCLNNLIQDNTMMKDYLVYQMMADFGADAPMCSFVYITVNGEDWGLYLGVEGVEDSFLQRTYGSEAGDLYKPDSMGFGGGRGNGRDFDMDRFEKNSEEDGGAGTETAGQDSQKTSAGDSASEAQNAGGASVETARIQDVQGSDGGATGSGISGDSGTDGGMPADGAGPGMPPGGNAQGTYGGPGGNDGTGSGGGQGGMAGGPGGGPGSMAGGPGDGGARGSDDVKLKYIDDDADSYTNIFENAKTDVTKADKKRLIAALKNLNAYTYLENTLDIDEVLRYFVVHNFVCNGDSYTGSMIHNYYLHEKDGKLSMIPWDYNLAFGTFMGNSASDAVNASIDSPVTGGDVDDRPMVGWIFSDQKYTDQYHELFAEFIDRWFSGGQLETLISETADLIRPYVEKDPTRFCTMEEFDEGIETMESLVSLRAEAVRAQLRGEETETDTGDLDLSTLGTMGGMGGQGGYGGPGGGFDLSDLFSVTDSYGRAVALTDLVGEITKITEIGLADGTSVTVDGSDMRSLMQTLMQVDFSKVVSVKDSEGKSIDLSAYSISLNMPSRGGNGQGGGSGRLGRMTDGAGAEGEQQAAEVQPEGGSAEAGAQQAAEVQPEAGSAEAGAQQSAGTRPDGGGQMPGPPDSLNGGYQAAAGMDRPGMGTGPASSGEGGGADASGQPSAKTTVLLVGGSVLVLAAGILIAVRKKSIF